MPLTEVHLYKSILDENEELLQYGSWSQNYANGELIWSPGMYKLLGLDAQEYKDVISGDWFGNTIVHPDDKELLYDAVTSAVQHKERFAVIARLLHTNGEYIIAQITGKCSYDNEGNLKRMVGINRNVTSERSNLQKLETLHAEQKLREQFLRYGSWDVNLPEMSIWWSPGMYYLYGYTDEANLPKVDIDFYNKHIDEDDLEKMRRIYQMELDTKGLYEWRYTIHTKDGGQRRLMSTGRYHYNVEGKPIKIFGITKDVTEEEQMTHDLQVKIEELNRSNKELEEFAYVASHDLQEPLRKLTSFSERLQLKYSDVLGKEGEMYTNRIMAAAGNMRNLIDNLLDFSRLSQVERKFEEVDLNKLMRKLIGDFEVQIQEADATVVFSHLPTIEGLPLQLDQLFCNLLSNALKFRRKEADCTIEVSSRLLTNQEKIKHHLQHKQGYWVITFHDNGIGFEPEYAEKIFTIFQRLHGKVEYPGSGVGLSICRKITDIHHGKIQAHSSPGKGAAFTVMLPQHQTTAPHTP